MTMRMAAILMAFGVLSFAQNVGGQTPQNAPQNAAANGAKSQRLRDFLGLGKPVDAVAAERGSKIYGQNCAFCHGVKATGAEGPDLVRSALVLHDENGDKVGAVLLKGRAERGMPAFPALSSEQIQDVAAFLHQRVELVANRGTYQLQNIVTGNAQEGAAYFQGAGQCTKCHSANGDLARIGSKYAPADLQAAFLYPGAVGDAARERSVAVKLQSGEVVKGKLRQVDDFNVSLLDGEGNYRSFERSPGVTVNIEDKLATHRELLSRYSDADVHNLLSYLVSLK